MSNDFNLSLCITKLDLYDTTTPYLYCNYLATVTTNQNKTNTNINNTNLFLRRDS
jgi:hypothetical protein